MAVLRFEIQVSHPLHRTQRMGHPGFLVVLAMWIFDLIVGLENAEILRWESFVVRTTPLPRMTGMWGIGSRFVVLGSQLVAAVK